MKPSQHTLVLIGDSTLDNIVWVNSHDKCTKAKLQKMFPEMAIKNFAADGFTSSEVIGGGVPTISWNKRKTDDPFPV